ncbi:hypothetical protein V7103_24990, partial [Neobacillus drentensis]|uniref:hypothetical protein n=1 Tax=Neobacillus drentensis TaxID=220684 RepID=UPI002FFDF9AC
MAFIFNVKKIYKDIDVINMISLTDFGEGVEETIWFAYYSEKFLEEVKNRLAIGDEGYVLYHSKGLPKLIAKINRIFSNEEFKEYNEGREIQIKIPEGGYENALVRFEKECQLVHPKIVEYLSPIVDEVSEEKIFDFDNSSYNNFLKENGIV